MRARPSELARTTAQPRAIELTQPDEVRAGTGRDFADAVERDGVGAALGGVTRAVVVAPRVVVRFAGAFATDFAEALGLARDGGAAAAGAVRFSVLGGATATRVVAFRVVGSLDAVAREAAGGAGAARAGDASSPRGAGAGAATTVSLFVAEDGRAMVTGGGAGGAVSVAAVAVVAVVAVVVGAVADTGGGDRRITDGGGSQGSRSRVVSTGAAADSPTIDAESTVSDSVPAAAICAVSAIAPNDSMVTVSRVPTGRVSESAPTTVVESAKPVVSAAKVSGLAIVGWDVSGLVVRVESAAIASTTGFLGDSSPRTNQAPMPILTKAPIPTPFQSLGPIGGFAGVVPHQRQAPWLSGYSESHVGQCASGRSSPNPSRTASG